MKELEKFRTYLNNIPRAIYYHTSNIKKEIDQIGIILKNYEEIQEKFNSKNLDIKKHVSDFLGDIQKQTQFIIDENKNINKELKKIDAENPENVLYVPTEGIDFTKEEFEAKIEQQIIQPFSAVPVKQIQHQNKVVDKKVMSKEAMEKQKLKDFKSGKYIPRNEVERLDMMFLLDQEREEREDDSDYERPLM